MTPPTRHLVIHVHGDPAPQGSKTHVGNGRMRESSRRVAPWRDAVQAAAMQALPKGWMLAGPVSVRIDFLVARPASHYGTGRNARMLRDNAPLYPVSRRVGDLDKLLRSTLDALTTAGVIVDDSLVVDIQASKVYGEPGDAIPGAVIFVGAL